MRKAEAAEQLRLDAAALRKHLGLGTHRFEDAAEILRAHRGVKRVHRNRVKRAVLAAGGELGRGFWPQLRFPFPEERLDDDEPEGEGPAAAQVAGVSVGDVYENEDGTRFLVTSLSGGVRVREVGGRRRVVAPDDWRRYRGRAVRLER